MLSSLGFDTIIVHADKISSNIEHAYNIFYEIGIKKVLLLFNYDPLCDSITLIKSRANEFKSLCSKYAYRRIKIKCALNLHITEGSVFNDSINRIYCNKSFKTIFVSLPLFTETRYQPIALDINNLLYKKKAFPVFTSFEKIIETSSLDFCSKFINNSRMGLTVDLNYLLNPQKDKLFNLFLTSNSLIIPTISQNMANYAGILPSADFALNKYGKKEYYKLCSQINKASLKIFAKF